MAVLTEAYAVGPAAPGHSDRTVGDLLRHAAQESPNHPALRVVSAESGQRVEWTYDQLLDESEHCARRLLTVFEPGDRLAVWGDNRPEWVILQFGAALAGLILVTVNPAFQPGEAKYVLGQSRAVGCFSVADHRGALLADITRQLQAELPSLRHVFELDQWREFLDGPVAEGELPTVATDDPVLIQYTSGTTGFPKGALLLHGRLTYDAEQIVARAALPTNSVWLMPIPLFHAGGCVMGVLGALSRQATIVLLPAWTAEFALQLIESERVGIMNAVPTMLIQMMRHEDSRRRDLSSLECVFAGGATVSADVVRELQDQLGLRVDIVFGQTECGPVATMTHPDDSPEDKQNTVGTPLPGFEVRIVNPLTGQTSAIGELGEFVARGNTMAAYFENPEATQAAFDEDGWLHTGDVCAMDERGYLRVEGRLRDMIIRGGENIYPREIEEALLAEPSVDDAAVVGLPEPELGEVVAAFVVPVPGAAFDKEEVTESLRAKLARFKVPQRWIIADELPRTPTGKIQKFLLRTQWESGEVAELADDESRSK